MKNNKNILVPLITPFNGDESVNYTALQSLVRKVIDEGADGIYAGGSSAECFLLTEQERKNTLEAVIEAAQGAHVVAHVGAFSSRIAVDYAKHAEKVGANMISSVPPFYFGYSFREIKTYYERLMQCVDIPLMIYNIPSTTKITFSLGELEELLANEKTTSIKFTDTDFFMLEQLKSHTGKFVYSGKDENFLSGLAAGADGGIGTTFNFMVKKFVSIYRLFSQGHIDRAREVQHEANEIISIVCDCGLFASTKYLLEAKGVDAGLPRVPFQPLRTSEKKRLDAIVDQIL